MSQGRAGVEYRQSSWLDSIDLWTIRPGYTMVVGTDLLFFRRQLLHTETVGDRVTREEEDMTAPANAADHGAAEHHMGALSQLILDANRAGLSYQDMANRGVDRDTGTRLPKQWYQKLVKTPPVNPPTPAQMHAIAAAIGKPVRRVKEATALQWLQYEATELSGYDEEVRIIVGHLAGKSKPELLRWRMMIEADEKARRQSED